MLQRAGLPSFDGGRHPGWGTANRIVPLGTSYLELIAVVDESEAAASAVGSWVSAAATKDVRPFAWCLRPDDLVSTARRLGLGVEDGSRALPDGRIARWRTVGINNAISDSALPFFIERAPGESFPGALRHDARPPAVVASIELEADPDRLAAWLGPHELPIDVRPGSLGIRRVVLEGPAGDIAFGADDD